MRFEAVKCDECGRIQGEANHWEQVGVEYEDGVKVLTVELGKLWGPSNPSHRYEVRDVCGLECRHKQVDKLLGARAVLEV